jgi:hypothetical protein
MPPCPDPRTRRNPASSLPSRPRFGPGLAACALALVLAGAAHAGQIGRDADLRRTGWYPDQPGISPQTVSRGAFGQLFSTAVTGQVFGQPLVYGGTLLVTTQSNWIYGLDPVTGAIRWSRNVGTPWNANDISGCLDIYPVVGITSTPVIDDATGIAYICAKSYRSGSSGPADWKLHAVSVATGAEQPGFPVTIQGTADNAPAQVFPPVTQNQRCGLLLLDGVVYIAFASVCDVLPYQGWVVGVSTAGVITCRWTDRVENGSSGGGIWMSGSALASDGPGQILLASGNGMGGGTPATPIPGHSPAAELCESVVRLAVQPGGSLQAVDFFTPWNSLAIYDPIDADLGSGGVIGLPAPYFGTAAHPNLVVQVGKPGLLFVLDGDSLGGCQQAPDGTDHVVQVLDIGGGVWSKPTVWGGDGGWVYVTTANLGVSPDGDFGYLNAYRYSVDGSGTPSLAYGGEAVDAFGFSSSAPILTSFGTQPGSALLWIVWNPDFTGVGAQLRAYDAVPVNGTLTLRYSAPVGMGSKFNPPGVYANRLYVGTRDGHVIGFGMPASGAGVAGDPAFPGRARLGVAYPNPFAGATTMELAMPASGPASLAIYDLSGRRMRRLVSGDVAAGSQHVVWDGRDDAGRRVPNGLYLARLDAAGARETRGVLLIR